jgi:beta-glucosidase-like glycosyl hydrolase
MTAHVVFSAIDPVAPATLSTAIVGGVIRDSMGFRGLLMSDAISMGALSGSLSERTAAAIAAGCGSTRFDAVADRAEFCRLTKGTWSPAEVVA